MRGMSVAVGVGTVAQLSAVISARPAAAAEETLEIARGLTSTLAAQLCSGRSNISPSVLR